MDRKVVKALMRSFRWNRRTPEHFARSRGLRRADPLLLAVVAAMLTIFGNMLVAYINNRATINQETLKAANDLKLEDKKARSTLLVQAMGTGDEKIAERNVKFFINSGLLEDQDGKIAKALDLFRPFLPSPGTNVGPQPFEVPDIARIYNFPAELDGSGQIIGVLELGGGYRPTEVSAYFEAVHLPVPKIIDMSIDGAQNRPNDAGHEQVLTDIEIIGAIAPKAIIRVYFAPNAANAGDTAFIHALNQAVKDHVSIMSIGWGSPESKWKEKEIRAVDDALQIAAKNGVTVLAATGDGGVTDGVKDGKPHVDFPASSPWVLAVGSTRLETSESQIISESAWNGTGGGFSDLFQRPDWQSAIRVPNSNQPITRRAIPDVATTGDPASGTFVRIGGERSAVGGTSVSAPMWAGLIALINQGLGHNVGYFNPLLYQKVGPAGILHSITQGNNGSDGVPGYSAAFGWNAVSGWGSPDGRRLLAWLRAHP